MFVTSPLNQNLTHACAKLVGEFWPKEFWMVTMKKKYFTKKSLEGSRLRCLIPVFELMFKTTTAVN